MGQFAMKHSKRYLFKYVFFTYLMKKSKPCVGILFLMSSDVYCRTDLLSDPKGTIQGGPIILLRTVCEHFALSLLIVCKNVKCISINEKKKH